MLKLVAPLKKNAYDQYLEMWLFENGVELLSKYFLAIRMIDLGYLNANCCRTYMND